MPPTRREQLELDELLSDIYRGIETLPDKSTSGQVYITNVSHYPPPTRTSNKSPSASSNQHLVARTHVREYELPASSPIVRQHKQELAALREAANSTNSSSSPLTTTKQPQRSTLKRQTTNTPEQQANGSRHQAPQSLAAFVTSSSGTPENRRRVRIVDPHPDRQAGKGAARRTTPVAAAAAAAAAAYSSDEDYDDQQQQQQQHYTNGRGKQTNVKYVNTNKLIYHQEQNPDDDERLSETNSLPGGADDDDDDNNNNNNNTDDLDGVTRVEYYHTTWLDRQLGRASKRRSSKELNERQVKEKAMIEELKRSLKNGAITLRQSFKGKKNHHHHHNSNSKPSETYDDQMLSSGKNRHKESTVFGSGLATIPRNYHQKQGGNNTKSGRRDNYNQSTNDHYNNNNTNYYRESPRIQHTATPKQTISDLTSAAAPLKSNTNTNIFDSCYQPVTEIGALQQQQQQQQQSIINQQKENQMQHQQPIYSKTLPHNYHPNKGHHQLLQSHYRGDKSQFNTLHYNSSRPAAAPVAGTNMGQFNNNNCGPGNKIYGQVKSPISQVEQQQQQQQQQTGNTISSIPSATEVVRSALSRSSSQASLNQLNKTINLLPQSPPPFGPSPMTPTHQLRPASPSLSPSPVNQPQANYTNRPTTPNTLYTSKTMGHQPQKQQQQQPPQQTCLYGTRTTGRAPQQQAQPQPQQLHQHQQQQQQQPVYANPHASLMQHKLDQQMNRSQGRNTASIREFNELDSMLRALSPASSVQITPAYNVKPAQPSFGYGYSPAAPQQQQQQQQPSRGTSDIYAKVQKPQPQAPLQQHYNVPSNNINNGAPFTIDVTENRKDPESCLKAQELSEFEPPIELLPSMEDYQNISKLNPVKNHYWYKPNMSRDRAIYLLRDKPQGTFIVRDSTSFKGAFGLAVKVAKLPKNIPRNPNADPSTELIRHFLIVPTSSGVQLKGYANEPVFGSLPNLIYQHSLTELALPCKLLIPRADIEDQKFNQKQKQFYDEFIASKEQAKHSPYDRTSPNGGYRKYPGDVYVHNEHRIIFE